MTEPEHQGLPKKRLRSKKPRKVGVKPEKARRGRGARPENATSEVREVELGRALPGQPSPKPGAQSSHGNAAWLAGGLGVPRSKPLRDSSVTKMVTGRPRCSAHETWMKGCREDGVTHNSLGGGSVFASVPSTGQGTGGGVHTMEVQQGRTGEGPAPGTGAFIS